VIRVPAAEQDDTPCHSFLRWVFAFFPSPLACRARILWPFVYVVNDAWGCFCASRSRSGRIFLVFFMFLDPTRLLSSSRSWLSWSSCVNGWKPITYISSLGCVERCVRACPPRSTLCRKSTPTTYSSSKGSFYLGTRTAPPSDSGYFAIWNTPSLLNVSPSPAASKVSLFTIKSFRDRPPSVYWIMPSRFACLSHSKMIGAPIRGY